MVVLAQPNPRYLALLDDMGLADERDRPFGESSPAPLGASEESIALFQAAMSGLRQPLLVTALVGTFGALGIALRSVVPRR